MKHWFTLCCEVIIIESAFSKKKNIFFDSGVLLFYSDACFVCMFVCIMYVYLYVVN